MPKNESKISADPAQPGLIAEVRYSLPELLREVKAERSSSTFSKDMLDQTEITKAFQGRKVRRAKPSK